MNLRFPPVVHSQRLCLLTHSLQYSMVSKRKPPKVSCQCSVIPPQPHPTPKKNKNNNNNNAKHRVTNAYTKTGFLFLCTCINQSKLRCTTPCHKLQVWKPSFSLNTISNENLALLSTLRSMIVRLCKQIEHAEKQILWISD
jgi:hypothetical protein